jgi:hypothetical protein
VKALVSLATIVSALGFAGPGIAHAQGRHVLVLRSEGSVDDATRTKIDAQVLKLAKNVRGNVEAADITLADATAAAGCVWTEPGCRDQVLSTMGVDELVATTTTTIGADLKITVRRIPKGPGAKEASTTIPSGEAPEIRMNAVIGPLFGLPATAIPPPVTNTPPPPDKTAPPDKISTTTVPPPDTTTVPPPDKISTTTVPPPDTTTVPPPDKTVPPPDTSTAPIGTHPDVSSAPNGQIAPINEGHTSRRRWEVSGLAVGGGLVLTGVILWGAAGGVQDDINSAPTRTLADIENLRSLESKGDTYTTVGNVMFASGIVLAGVSGYFFWRDRHSAHGQQAMIVPTMFDHGAGVAFTFGGSNR